MEYGAALGIRRRPVARKPAAAPKRAEAPKAGSFMDFPDCPARDMAPRRDPIAKRGRPPRNPRPNP
jgi:hypothetical protein